MAFRLFLGNVASGAQPLTPSLYSDADTFYAATVSTGAVTLTPALYVNENTFHDPTVAPGMITLEPEYFSKKPYVAIVLAA